MPFIGVDRKSSIEGQKGAFDPKRTCRTNALDREYDRKERVVKIGDPFNEESSTLD